MKANVSSCRQPFSAEDFFEDSPWLNVPINRRGVILVEPLRPHIGLLGGSPKSDGPPRSKLAALAAARRKKENQKAEDDKKPTNSVATLEKLSPNSRNPSRETRPSRSVAEDAKVTAPDPDQLQRHPARTKQGHLSVLDQEPSGKSETSPQNLQDVNGDTLLDLAPTAGPSTFAKSIFGPPTNRDLGSEPLKPLFSASAQAGSRANFNAFAGPSPDDVVQKAQSSSKGAR